MSIKEGDQITLIKEWTEDREVFKTKVIRVWFDGWQRECHLENGDVLQTYHASPPNLKGDCFCKVTIEKAEGVEL